MVTPGKYRHYKGGEYEVVFNGLDENTETPVVVYRSLYDNPKSEIWVRTAEDFLKEVEVDGQMVPRFSKID